MSEGNDQVYLDGDLCKRLKQVFDLISLVLCICNFFHFFPTFFFFFFDFFKKKVKTKKEDGRWF